MALRVIIFGNGPRGAACLASVVEAGHTVCAVVAHAGDSQSARAVRDAAAAANLECVQPADPHHPDFLAFLAAQRTDVFVLAGYSPILRRPLFALPRLMTINTHAGELPGMRGSSPLNWALLEGRSEVTLSIIRVNAKVDGGDVLTEKTVGLTDNTTIAELQDIANTAFPSLIVETLAALERGSITPRPQDDRRSTYYPLRFSEDGLILWDQMTAVQAHNCIRALTVPYPCAFTYGAGHRIRLLKSELTATPVRGEPGRIYRKSARGLLVCASDRCLWITRAETSDEGRPAAEILNRYDRMATMREAAMRLYESGVTR